MDNITQGEATLVKIRQLLTAKEELSAGDDQEVIRAHVNSFQQGLFLDEDK